MKSKKVEQVALELPAKERAALAERLLESLDELSEQEAAELWRQEAARRAAQLDSGELETIPHAEVEQSLDKLFL